jgi:hypothetical protein
MPGRCSLLLVLLALLTLLTTGAAQNDPRRHGGDTKTPGLPADIAAFAPYDADPEHLLNRVFRAAWLANLTPAEVGAPADSHAPIEWTSGWVHRKRAGMDADARWFGGDGRLLPLEALSTGAATELAALLDQLAPGAPAVTALQATPALAVLCQHDLLRVAERLLATKQSPELVPKVVRAAEALALPIDVLAGIADPLRAALAANALVDLAPVLPTAFGGNDANAREVLRQSTRLFDGEKTLLWSRLFLTHPGGPDALAKLLPDALAEADRKRGPTVPIGMRAVLVQGIVAIARDGTPRATPLVFDVRVQTLANRDPLAADNATFTRDGIDFTILQLERQGVRTGPAQQLFRRIGADEHDLFRDYGTSKHTTWRGQCTLCHRTTDTPEGHLGGFPVLRPHAQATFAATGDERLRLAETQVDKLLARLRSPR